MLSERDGPSRGRSESASRSTPPEPSPALSLASVGWVTVRRAGTPETRSLGPGHVGCFLLVLAGQRLPGTAPDPPPPPPGRVCMYVGGVTGDSTADQAGGGHVQRGYSRGPRQGACQLGFAGRVEIYSRVSHGCPAGSMFARTQAWAVHAGPARSGAAIRGQCPQQGWFLGSGVQCRLGARAW